jgi:hypothetical protein
LDATNFDFEGKHMAQVSPIIEPFIYRAAQTVMGITDEKPPLLDESSGMNTGVGNSDMSGEQGIGM